MREQQHDHHCVLVAYGELCRIVQVQMPQILVRCENGCCTGIIDTSGMDFGSYCATAAMNDFANAVRAERGLPVVASSEARN